MRVILVADLSGTSDAEAEAAKAACRPREPFRPTSLVAPPDTGG